MYSLDWLRQRHQANEPIQYLLFWGHRPDRDGSVGKGCFSQWWPSPFQVDGVTYPTAEHWMMAEKARLFGDKAMHEQILAAKTPAEAKKLGRKVRSFDPAVWQAASFAIVATGNRHKFTQHNDLRTYLLGTGQQVLVEASPTDAIWGIGLAQDDPAATDPTRWPGTNLLGFALMTVRDQLANA